MQLLVKHMDFLGCNLLEKFGVIEECARGDGFSLTTIYQMKKMHFELMKPQFKQRLSLKKNQRKLHGNWKIYLKTKLAQLKKLMKKKLNYHPKNVIFSLENGFLIMTLTRYTKKMNLVKHMEFLGCMLWDKFGVTEESARDDAFH